MTDPLRLSDDSDRALSLLLRAGQNELPPSHALEKTIAGLGAATTVIGASQVAGAAVTAGKLGVWTLAKWAGAGVLSGVITVGGVELVQHGIESSRRPVVSDASSVSAKPAPRTFEARHGSAPLVVAEPLRESENVRVLPQQSQPQHDRAPLTGSGVLRDGPASKPSGPATAPAVLRSAPAPSELDSTISIEIGLIDEARRALQAGRAASALEALNRHRTEVKQKRLAPEAQYLEMEALFAIGNKTSAGAAARALLERYPKGPHAARAQSILEAR